MAATENTPNQGAGPRLLDLGVDLELQGYMDHLVEREAENHHRAVTANLREVLLQVVNHNGPAMLVETKDGMLQVVPLDEPQGGDQ